MTSSPGYTLQSFLTNKTCSPIVLYMYTMYSHPLCYFPPTPPLQPSSPSYKSPFHILWATKFNTPSVGIVGLELSVWTWWAQQWVRNLHLPKPQQGGGVGPHEPLSLCDWLMTGLELWRLSSGNHRSGSQWLHWIQEMAFCSPPL